jgi:DNA-binding response OmpR family regulator
MIQNIEPHVYRNEYVPEPPKEDSVILYYEGRKIYLADKVLKVTAKEFDLLEYFVKHKGMILSRDKILDSVWGFDYIGGYRSVDTLVKKLRAKLTKEYPYIKTVYGVGYCFDV